MPDSCCVTMTQKRLMLFAGRSNPALGERIAEKLGIRLGDVLLKTFANGEIYARYGESIRGADVFIVQSPARTLNAHVMEVFIMVQAAKLASARRVTVVLPYYPVLAARQEERRPRADHGAPHRHAARGGRRRPRAQHGPPPGPDPGLLRDPGRPHDGRADAGRLLPLQGLRRHAAGRRVGRRRRRQAGQAFCQSRRRRPRRAHQDAPRAQSRRDDALHRRRATARSPSSSTT